MHQIRISDVHKSMLKELCKKFNMKEQEMVEEQIQESYNTIFARRKR